MKTAIVNLGPILSGDWRVPYASGDAVALARERDRGADAAVRAGDGDCSPACRHTPVSNP